MTKKPAVLRAHISVESLEAEPTEISAIRLEFKKIWTTSLEPAAELIIEVAVDEPSSAGRSTGCSESHYLKASAKEL